MFSRLFRHKTVQFMHERQISQIARATNRVLNLHPSSVSCFSVKKQLRNDNEKYADVFAQRVRAKLGVEVHFETFVTKSPFNCVLAWDFHHHQPAIFVEKEKGGNGAERFEIAHCLGHLFLEFHWYPHLDLAKKSNLKQSIERNHGILKACVLPSRDVEVYQESSDCL